MFESFTRIFKKSKSLRAMVHPGGGVSFFQLLSRTKYDYAADIGDGTKSSTIMAPVQWIQRTFPEAPLIVSKNVSQRGTEKPEEVEGHGLTALINNPNPFYGEAALWMATVFSWCVDGNAYWLKIRNGIGNPVQLWYVPHWLIKPARPLPSNSTIFISHYEYRPGGDKFDIPVEDVIHFRHGIDPNNPQCGMSPLRSVMRDVWSDDEASNWVASLLKNSGVPGVVISPDGANPIIGMGDVDQVKGYIKEMFSGDRRGEPLVMSGPTKVQEFGYDPNKMNLTVVRDTAEERACAALGIPAAVIGFGTGLETTKVGATMREFSRLAWSDGIVPIQRIIANEIARSLLPDFEDSPEDFEVAFDYANVSALQENQTDLYTRANMAVIGGWITVAQAKRIVGLVPEGPEDDVYLRQSSTIEVSIGGMRPIMPPNTPDLGAVFRQLLHGGANGNGNASGADQLALPGANGNGPPKSAILELKDIDLATYHRIQKIASELEPALRDTFLTAIRKAREAATLAALEQALSTADPAAAIRVATAGLEFSAMRETLAQIVEASGFGATRGLMRVTGQTIGSFDLKNPYAVEYINAEAALLVRGITDSTRQGIQSIVKRSFVEGIAPRDAAREIRGLIGLTEYQTNVVHNYQLRLLDEGATNVDGKVARYAQQTLNRRAVTIARTETIAASNAGQSAAWQAAMDKGYIDADTHQVWMVAHDDRLCPICEPMPDMPENQDVRIGGSFTTGEGKQVKRPPAHPQCLAPDVEVDALKSEIGLRAKYRGFLRTIEAGGRRLTVGPNHPILTPRGFVAARLLNEGDYVLCGEWSNRKSPLVDPNKNNRPTASEEIFESLLKTGSMLPISVPSTAEDLHGDGRSVDGDIEIVRANGFLKSDIESGAKQIDQLTFQVGAIWRLLASRSASGKFVQTHAPASGSIVSGFNLPTSLFARHSIPFYLFRLRLASWLNSIGNQFSPESGSSHFKFLRDLIPAVAGDVSFKNIRKVGGVRNSMANASPSVFKRGASTSRLDAIRNQVGLEGVEIDSKLLHQTIQAFTVPIAPQRLGKIRSVWHVGHIYDLQAFGGIYFANGILASNCRCTMSLDIQ